IAQINCVLGDLAGNAAKILHYAGQARQQGAQLLLAPELALCGYPRDLMPSELSGGMERRVALARAIATDPTLIIYDEPFAGLDPVSLNTIANLIRKLNDALGVTSVVVTYDLSESLKIADYVYFIHDGVVVAEGETSKMLDSDNPFVRQFLHAQPDGPVAFQYPSVIPYVEELGIRV
ncbi:MAG: ATP-binding cassette domain-containing protein, partial [Desulfobacteraceae bacterium]